MNDNIFIDKKEGFTLKLYVVPKSSINQIAGIYKERLKIKITAPAKDNMANKALLSFISKMIKILKSSLEILSGHTSKNKTVMVFCNKNKKELRDRITLLLK